MITDRTIYGNLLVNQIQIEPDQNITSESDKEAIKKVIQDYLDVTDKKDYDALKRAFHPTGKLLSVNKTGLREMSQEEWWSRVSRIPGNIKRVSQISLIDIRGLAAVVRVDFEKSSDYISLLKINGEWKIVNKTLSTMLNL
ncbi:MAG: nuclear transport factor 2 family protein [Acidobacteriota bacterium]